MTDQLEALVTAARDLRQAIANFERGQRACAKDGIVALSQADYIRYTMAVSKAHKALFKALEKIEKGSADARLGG